MIRETKAKHKEREMLRSRKKKERKMPKLALIRAHNMAKKSPYVEFFVPPGS